jgi:hypothetical protein
MAHHHEKPGGPLAILAIVAAVALFFILMGSIYFYRGAVLRRKELETQRVLAQRLADQRAYERDLLTTTSLVDTGQQLIRIPIDRAIFLQAAQPRPPVVSHTTTTTTPTQSEIPN